MALDFPTSPSIGQTFPGPNGVIWQWDGNKWVAGALAGTVFAPLDSPAFTGNPTAPNPPAGDADTSVSTTQFVQQAVAGPLRNIGRNYIQNPLFNVAQRGAGPWTASGNFTLDRWSIGATTDAVSITQQALSDANRTQIGDFAAESCLQNTFTGNAAAGAFNYISQTIENVQRLAGKTVTVSFFALATSALKLGINVLQSFGSGGSPSASAWALATGMSVTTSTTFARYSVTFAIPNTVGKVLGTNHDHGTAITIWYSSGANANALAGNIGVQSGTVYLWGVQLEIGTSATPLEKPDPRYDLANCQRFYTSTTAWLNGPGTAGAGFGVGVTFAVPMRTSPTLGVVSSSNANLGASPNTLASFANGMGFVIQYIATATTATQLSALVTASADL